MYLIRKCRVDGKDYPAGHPIKGFRKGTIASLKSAGWVIDYDPTKTPRKPKDDGEGDDKPAGKTASKPRATKKRTTKKKSS